MFKVIASSAVLSLIAVSCYAFQPREASIGFDHDGRAESYKVVTTGTLTASATYTKDQAESISPVNGALLGFKLPVTIAPGTAVAVCAILNGFESCSEALTVDGPNTPTNIRIME